MYITRVGRWRVVHRQVDPRKAISSKELQALELRAAILVFTTGTVRGGEMKFARKAMGLRQPELGKLLGVAAETVSRWETGADPFKRYVSLAVLYLLEKYQRTGDVLAKSKKPRGTTRKLVA